MSATMCPRTETYLDVENLLYDTVHKFQRRYGGRFECLISEARQHYSQAYQTYNPQRARFTTWAVFNVWHGLLETKRTEARHAAKLPRISLDLLKVPERVKAPLMDLSDDANTMIRLALARPERGPIKKRVALMELLLDFGWSGAKIQVVYDEVKAALA